MIGNNRIYPGQHPLARGLHTVIPDHEKVGAAHFLGYGYSIILGVTASWRKLF